MIAALESLFFGEFAGYREVLTTFDDPRPAQPVHLLLRGAGLESLLQHHAGQDRRALASQWSKHYLVRLIPPVVAASLLLQHHLPLAFDRLEVVLDEKGLPEAFKLPDPGAPFVQAPSDAFERFASLDQHLQAFVSALASAVRISPKVLWSNAGNYLEWFLGELASFVPRHQLQHGHDLLEQALRPDGSRNPLWQPVRYVEVPCELRPGGLWRQRRVCCIRYRLDSFGHCDNCPLLEQPPPYIEVL